MTEVAPGPPPPGPMAARGVPRQATPRATWLLAPNPGPMTFDGTNSWVLHEPGHRGAVIVDPGPDDPAHLSALVSLALEAGGRVDAILLTHGHPDHSAGLRETARLTGAPVLGASPRWCDTVVGAGPLDVGGLRVDVVPTPGHSSDSLSFHLPADSSVLTGDTVLGRSAPVILHPDGRVDQMIDSLRRLRDIIQAPPGSGDAGSGDAGSGDAGPVILPGHGPLVTDPAGVLTFALAARESRLSQVEEAVSDGCDTVGVITDRLYGPFDERIRRMIEMTVRAHLVFLRDRGRLAQPVRIDD